MKRFLPTREDLKLLLITGLVLFIAYGSFAVIRSLTVDPQLDAEYAEIYGMEDDNNE